LYAARFVAQVQEKSHYFTLLTRMYVHACAVRIVIMHRFSSGSAQQRTFNHYSGGLS